MAVLLQEMQGKGLSNVSEVSGKHLLELLRGISGAFRPGILTCLMGVSGAGKTTLMDVLSGRKTGERFDMCAWTCILGHMCLDTCAWTCMLGHVCCRARIMKSGSQEARLVLCSQLLTMLNYLCKTLAVEVCIQESFKTV